MVSNESNEIVNNYTHLGVKFSANGNFTNHKENLTEKTKRSFSAARRYLELPIHIMNKLFNTLFFPILTCRFEVWGIYENISDKMAEENKSGLINKINLLCTQLNINKQSVNFKNPSTFLSKAENNLSKHLKNHQLNLIRTNKKLFYSIFKNRETNNSEFINHIRNPEHRHVASKFRIEDHNLKIETGRFTIPKSPEDLRICDHCYLNSVENELYILFHCDLYNDLRNTLFIKINGRNILFTN